MCSPVAYLENGLMVNLKSMASDNSTTYQEVLQRLMIALDLASAAVDFDSRGNNPLAAVQTYAVSVEILTEIMDRLQSFQENQLEREESEREALGKIAMIHRVYMERMAKIRQAAGVQSMGVPYN